MGMVTDRQVYRLRAFLAAGKPVSTAALRTDMDEKTARKYRDLGKLPSELEPCPELGGRDRIPSRTSGRRC